MKVSLRFTLIVLFIVCIALLRFALVDYANFAPIAAAGIFGLYFLRNKWLAIPLALGALFLSDLFIQLQTGHGLYVNRLFDYAALALGLVTAYFILLKQQSFPRAILAALLGSVIFFLLSNFVVWMMSGMYAKTFAGLLTCYEMAIPFFRGTLLGDVAFTALFIGGFSALQANVPQLQYKNPQ